MTEIILKLLEYTNAENDLPLNEKLKFEFNPNSIEGGGGEFTCDARFSEKCPCLHNNNAANNKTNIPV